MREALDSIELTSQPVQNQDHAPATDSPPTLIIRARTARNWLKKLGLKYGRLNKNVFKDGHERDDVVRYRQEVFAPTFCEYLKSSARFDEKGNLMIPEGVERPIIFVTHDESHFNANDAKMFMWTNDDIRSIRPKGKGKGIMVSDFLTPGGRLSHGFEDGKREYASELIETGAGKEWWTNAMMMQQLKKAVTIFKKEFPSCTGLWLFDNSTNHGAFASDALVASKVRLNPSGKQPKMRNGYFGEPKRTQPMCFPPDSEYYPGEPKGARVILQERGLWRDGLILTCQNRPGPSRKECSPSRDCCAQAILGTQPDFLQQKSQIEEYLLSQDQQVLFYPKFHCECNWIERYWGYCKRYTRENCTYSITGLRQNVPAALIEVPPSTIKRYFDRSVRIIKAYADDVGYETEEFKKRVYHSHRRLEEKEKW